MQFFIQKLQNAFFNFQLHVVHTHPHTLHHIHQHTCIDTRQKFPIHKN